MRSAFIPILLAFACLSAGNAHAHGDHAYLSMNHSLHHLLSYGVVLAALVVTSVSAFRRVHRKTKG